MVLSADLIELCKDKNKANFEKEFVDANKNKVVIKQAETFNNNIIFVDGKEFKYDMKERIFFLSQTCPEASLNKGLARSKIVLPVDDCHACKRELDLKKFAQCEFCGLFGCGDCINKSYDFPNQPHKKADEK